MQETLVNSTEDIELTAEVPDEPLPPEVRIVADALRSDIDKLAAQMATCLGKMFYPHN